jgi:hypothetical protein
MFDVVFVDIIKSYTHTRIGTSRGIKFWNGMMFRNSRHVQGMKFRSKSKKSLSRKSNIIIIIIIIIIVIQITLDRIYSLYIQNNIYILYIYMY